MRDICFYRSIFLLNILFLSCTSKDKEINYFRLVRFDTINLLESQVPLYQIQIDPDPTYIYLTEYNYKEKNDSIVEAIPMMIKTEKNSLLINYISNILNNIDTTNKFAPYYGAYGISTINSRYYVETNPILDSICSEFIKEMKARSHEQIDYFEFYKQNGIPLPPLQSRINK